MTLRPSGGDGGPTAAPVPSSAPTPVTGTAPDREFDGRQAEAQVQPRRGPAAADHGLVSHRRRRAVPAGPVQSRADARNRRPTRACSPSGPRPVSSWPPRPIRSPLRRADDRPGRHHQPARRRHLGDHPDAGAERQARRRAGRQDRPDPDRRRRALGRRHHHGRPVQRQPGRSAGGRHRAVRAAGAAGALLRRAGADPLRARQARQDRAVRRRACPRSTPCRGRRR